ncbi:MAG: glycine cleavage system protein H, partial [Candidatus Omnitrophica bacterium]|nr:glycine cleavage system protein H [Candidatus Omnitrophota bacterium]
NQSPYGDGWLFQMECSDLKELDSLLGEAEYQSVKHTAH